MNILLLGSLGPNQDRILVLARLGHKLVYAYSEFLPEIVRLESDIVCFPLVRRNLPDLIRVQIARHEIDVIYSLLNVSDGSTEATLELLDSRIGIPIVRHYKEHPCIPTVQERRALLETDGQVYINEQSFEYFRKAYAVPSWSAHIMDADMISERYMLNNFASKLSIEDGEPHLLVAGGMSMLNDRFDVRDLCVEMNRHRVHVHLYGYMLGEDLKSLPIIHHQPTQRAYERLALALPYVHLHEYIGPDQFSAVWSRYDAGFMHSKSDSNKHLSQFEQMNLPCRYSAYLAAGLPLVVLAEGQEAMRTLIEQYGIGIVFSDYDDLAEQLYDAERIATLGSVVSTNRNKFSFDSNADRLIHILETYARRK
ncbi:MAG: hypothetical protein WCF57_09575 [Pyrinomonadaceae bacterium]